MNRTHIAVWILGILAAGCVYGTVLVSHACCMITDQLQQIESLSESGHSSLAQRKAQELEHHIRADTSLKLYIRRDIIAELDATLSGIAAYTGADNLADLHCEIEKARSQMRTLKDSFFGFT